MPIRGLDIDDLTDGCRSTGGCIEYKVVNVIMVCTRCNTIRDLDSGFFLVMLISKQTIWAIVRWLEC